MHLLSIDRLPSVTPLTVHKTTTQIGIIDPSLSPSLVHTVTTAVRAEFILDVYVKLPLCVQWTSCASEYISGESYEDEN